MASSNTPPTECTQQSACAELDCAGCEYCETSNTDIDRVAINSPKPSGSRRFIFVPESKGVKAWYGPKVTVTPGQEKNPEIVEAMKALVFKKPGSGRQDQKEKLRQRLATRLAEKKGNV